MTDLNFQYHVKITWSHQINNINSWDKVCADGIEQFGLPGDKYITDVNPEYMTWSFRSNLDALIFRLKYSEAVL